MSEQAPSNVQTTEKPPVVSDTKEGTSPKGKSYLKQYFAQSVKTPEEHEAEAQKPGPQKKTSEPFSIRQLIHENVSQAVPAEEPPLQPVAKSDPEAQAAVAPKREHLGIKESFKAGASSASKKPEVESVPVAKE